jgi:probable HAF family extracellular repeat protein
LLLALSILYAAPGYAQQYTLTPIPLPNLSSLPPPANASGAYVVGNGLNNAGEVAGNVGGLIGISQQAFVYSQGSSQLLPTLYLPGLFNSATAVNLSGTIVGESENTLAQGNAVSWQSGSITDLRSLYYYTHVGPSPIPGYSSAAAINSKGDAVGVSLGAAGGSTTTDTHAALFSGGAASLARSRGPRADNFFTDRRRPRANHPDEATYFALRSSTAPGSKTTKICEV